MEENLKHFKCGTARMKKANQLFFCFLIQIYIVSRKDGNQDLAIGPKEKKIAKEVIIFFYMQFLYFYRRQWKQIFKNTFPQSVCINIHRNSAKNAYGIIHLNRVHGQQQKEKKITYLTIDFKLFFSS